MAKDNVGTTKVLERIKATRVAKAIAKATKETREESSNLHPSQVVALYAIATSTTAPKVVLEVVGMIMYARNAKVHTHVKNARRKAGRTPARLD